MNEWPTKVRVVEVGCRDGLQNEKEIVSIDNKITFLNMLADSGLDYIEAGSFVSPKWVPQMADTVAIMQSLKRRENVCYATLVPNVKGMEKAVETKVDEVAVFVSASEAFSQKNINCSIEESINRTQLVMQMAKEHNIDVRAYISCIVACPYSGVVEPQAVYELTTRLIDMGCREISLGETIGVATPNQITVLLQRLKQSISIEKLAVHFHDTYGQAIANIYAALQEGIQVVDSAVAGLGGCPYAKGASGNVASEDVLYLLQGMGIETGVDLHKLIAAGHYISQQLGRTSRAKTAIARH